MKFFHSSSKNCLNSRVLHPMTAEMLPFTAWQYWRYSARDQFVVTSFTVRFKWPFTLPKVKQKDETRRSRNWGSSWNGSRTIWMWTLNEITLESSYVTAACQELETPSTTISPNFFRKLYNIVAEMMGRYLGCTTTAQHRKEMTCQLYCTLTLL